MQDRYIRLETRKVCTFKDILTFDIYFKLNETRYLILFSKGAWVEEARLKQYLQKKLRYLYVLAEDQAELEKYLQIQSQKVAVPTVNLSLDPGLGETELGSLEASQVIDAPELLEHEADLSAVTQLTSEDFKRLEEQTAELTLKCAQDLFFNRPIRPDYIEKTQKLVQNYMSIMVSNPDIISVLLRNISKDSYFAYHSMSVSVLSLLIAFEYAPENTRLHELVGLSGFLHDIGKAGSNDHQYNPVVKPDLLKNPIYLRHPEAGLRLLKNCKIPEEARIIVAQHHEEYDGRGFPNRVNAHIYFPSRIVAIANKISKLVSRRPFGLEMPIEKALDLLKQKIAPQEIEIWKCIESLYKMNDKSEKIS